MKAIKYIIALFIFTNVLLSCTADTAVEDAQLAKQETIEFHAEDTGGEGSADTDDERDE